jgi:hypothetical protein
MAMIGFVLVIVSAVGDLGGPWMLTGLMLVVAGSVKIVTVAIWNGFARLGPIKTTDDST